LFVYLGTLGGSMLRDGPPAALQLGLLAVGLMTLGLVTWLITVRARAMLQDRIVGST
jgi:hypothetical protein